MIGNAFATAMSGEFQYHERTVNINKLMLHGCILNKPPVNTSIGIHVMSKDIW